MGIKMGKTVWIRSYRRLSNGLVQLLPSTEVHKPRALHCERPELAHLSLPRVPVVPRWEQTRMEPPGAQGSCREGQEQRLWGNGADAA